MIQLNLIHTYTPYFHDTHFNIIVSVALYRLLLSRQGCRLRQQVPFSVRRKFLPEN